MGEVGPVAGFVLAAGFGQRMLPITETVPKPLLPVGHLPLIAYALRLLQHHGITHVFVNLHHLGKVLRDTLQDGAAYGVQIDYSPEEEILGTGGALKRIHERLTTTLVVINSDTLIDIDLQAAVAEHRARGALATMVLREAPPNSAYGRIDIDAEGRIVRLLGQGEAPTAQRSLMFTGVQIIEPGFLEYVPPALHSCIIRTGYAKALSHHAPLYAHVHTGYWADAGTPADYLQVNSDALAQRLNFPHANALGGYALTPKREVAEVVRMGEGVDLGASTRLQPPVLLGEGAKLGERAVIGPGSIIGAQAQVGKDAHLRGCIVLDGAKVESGLHLETMLVGKKSMLALGERQASE